MKKYEYIFFDFNGTILDDLKLSYNLLLELKGEHLAMLEMRSHVSWYIKGRPGSAKIKDFCNKQTDFNIVIETLRKYLLEGIGL